jgi:hypothetical protein
MVNQVDNVGMTDGSSNADVRENRNTPSKNTGRLTSYWIESNADGTQTTIYKSSTKSEYITESDKSVDLPHGDIRDRLMNSRPIYNNTSNDYSKNSSDLTNAVKANTVKAAQFFISQPNKSFLKLTLLYFKNVKLPNTIQIVLGSLFL